MADFILGLHAGHNAGACVGTPTELLFAIQEERLTGEKNYWGFPKQSINACLHHVGATTRDLVSIACGGNRVVCRYHAREDVMAAYRRQSTFVGRLRQQLAMPLITTFNSKFGQNRLKECLAEAGFGDVPRVHYDHHYTHASTAYFGLRESPQQKYLVLTCDGVGDQVCATVRVMGGGEDRLVASTPWGESLGAIYAWVTYEMGFVPMEHEYKLMGMAPYASNAAAEEHAKIFHRYLGMSADGLCFRRKLRKSMHDIHSLLISDMRGKRFDYICAGLQRFTEDMFCQWVSSAVKATGVGRVLAAGGVFMNVKANKRIAELPGVESFEAYPSCSDETLPLGAYYLEAANRYRADSIAPLKHFYLGDAIEDAQAEAAIRASGFAFERPANISDRVAEILVAGHPVARAAGRMEFGARALGNRSILADPGNQDVVRVINQMVKKRDFWMPFAPMVIARRQHEYLHNPKQLRSPYMMMTFDSRDNFRDLIAAVHNADLTCRAQILEPHHNPDMYAILEAFERKTGRGVVLNTSFNLHGFPIVRTAEDALYVLKNSGLEYLQLANFLVKKRTD